MSFRAAPGDAERGRVPDASSATRAPRRADTPSAARWGRLFAAPLALCLAAALPAALADRAHTPLCEPGTPAVFSCATTGGKVLSLCGSPPASLQYRFGTPARVELAFPDNPADGTRRMRFAQYSRYQVDRTTVAFERDGVGYTVFDGTEGRKRSAGVEVLLPGATSERTFRCRGPVTGGLLGLKPHLPCDAESALQGGTCR